MSVLIKNCIIAIIMLLAMITAVLMRPTVISTTDSTAIFEEIIPKQFGDWHEVPNNQIQINLSVGREGEPTTDSPYDDVLMRTYINSKGQQVMLALAYGKAQKQEVKIHRPELCYVAQGFQASKVTPVNIMVDGQVIPATSMVASSAQRSELVLYWIRIGNTISQSPWQTRWYIFKQGLKGNVVDGILVRTSQILIANFNENVAVKTQSMFLSDLLQSVPSKHHLLLLP